MSDTIVTHYDRFERIELVEARYEELLADLSPRLFPEYRWFEYKPSVGSIHGVAQPDAVLIAKDGSEWWVVEVELARHWVRHHVEEQLTRLRDGWYGKKEREYIRERNADAADLVDAIARREPKFLLVLDEPSGPIERLARDLDFEVVHVIPFMSGKNLYAAAIDGVPRARTRARPLGIAARLLEDAPTARFVLYRDDETIPSVDSQVLVGNRLVKLFCQSDRRGFVVALARSELLSLLGEAPLYVLTIDSDQPVRLAPLHTLGDV